MAKSGWIGVDLDGTLAHYEGWNGGSIGEPVPLMAERVRAWLAEGTEVRILTARVGEPLNKWDGYSASIMAKGIEEQRELIQAWTLKHFGQALTVTASKDFAMVELWDDRAVTVEMNTGRVICAGGPS